MCYFSSFGRHATCLERNIVMSGASLNQSWKNSIRIFNQIKLILEIIKVRALKSQLVSKIEFSK